MKRLFVLFVLSFFVMISTATACPSKLRTRAQIIERLLPLKVSEGQTPEMAFKTTYGQLLAAKSASGVRYNRFVVKAEEINNMESRGLVRRTADSDDSQYRLYVLNSNAYPMDLDSLGESRRIVIYDFAAENIVADFSAPIDDRAVFLMDGDRHVIFDFTADKLGIVRKGTGFVAKAHLFYMEDKKTVRVDLDIPAESLLDRIEYTRRGNVLYIYSPKVIHAIDIQNGRLIRTINLPDLGYNRLYFTDEEIFVSGTIGWVKVDSEARISGIQKLFLPANSTLPDLRVADNKLAYISLYGETYFLIIHNTETFASKKHNLSRILQLEDGAHPRDLWVESDHIALRTTEAFYILTPTGRILYKRQLDGGFNILSSHDGDRYYIIPRLAEISENAVEVLIQRR